MLKQLVCLLLLMGSVTAQVRAEQGCPYPLSVKYVDDHFEVVDKKVLWQSQKIEKSDFIDVFIGAVFNQAKARNGKAATWISASIAPAEATLSP